ncbi:MAG: hypothetical protein QM775_16780 [Pirellulales bacterium]
MLGTIPGGFTSITLNRTDTTISITTGALIVGTSYWTGLNNNAWNSSAQNWSTDKAGTTPAASIPGQGTDVVFVANSHAGGALVTTLEQNFKVNSLTFEASTNTPASVTINPGAVATSRLEVAPQTATDGVRITAGGPAAVTIASAFKLGAAQTWNVADAGSVLTFSGALQGEADVTKSGAGKVVLSAAADAAFNAGLTTDVTVAGGTLEMTNLAALGTTAIGNSARVAINTNAAFYYTNAAATTALAPVGVGLTLAGGTLSLGGANQFYGGDAAVTADSFINLRGNNSAAVGTAAFVMTLSGALSGSGSLTVDSVNTLTAGNAETGQLILTNNANSWNGDLILNRGTVITTAANGLGGGDITFNLLGRIIVRGVDGTTLNTSGTMTFAAGALGEFQVDNTGALASDFVFNQNGLVTLGAGGTGATARFSLADAASTLNITGGIILGGNGSISLEGGDVDSRLNISSVISDGGSGYSLALNDDAGAWGATNGVIRLTGLNTFSGNVTIGEGTVEFDTVTDAGGAASSLGRGNTITMGLATLRFIGDGAANSQTTNRALTTTANGTTLSANGTNGATITYAGGITVTNVDSGRTLFFTGATGSKGFVTGGITMTGTAADIYVGGGDWTFSGTPLIVADDFVAENAGTILNLNTTGIITNTGGSTSNGFYSRGGAIIEVNANDIFGVNNANGIDFITLGDSGTTGIGILDLNSFNLTAPMLNLGSYTDGLEGALYGSGGTLTLTGTTSDWSSAARLWRGTISANLAGNTTMWKLGPGLVTLSGDNTNLTGASVNTRVEGGELVLDYTTNNTRKIASNVALDMRGGLVRLVGNASADTAQTINGLILAAGSSRISLQAGVGRNLTLSLGGITRSATAPCISSRPAVP